MTDTLTHLTLDTGRVTRSTRADVTDETVAFLRPIVAAGGELPGPVPWALAIERREEGWARYAVVHPDGPAYVECVGCWQDEASSDAWTRGGLRTSGPAPAVPWLAVQFGPAFATLMPEAAFILGDLERCVFWTLAEID